MENKRKNVYITIFIITTIVAACVAVYFGISGNNEVEELKAQINELNKKVEIKEENVNVDETDKSEGITEITTSGNTVSNEKDSSLIDVSAGLDENYYLIKNVPSLTEGIKVKIQDGKAYVAILDSTIGTGSYDKEKGKFYEIQNVSGKIFDACIAKTPTSGYPIFVLLMSDGTLQKTKFVSGSDIVCEGKIEGYSDIVKISNVECENKNVIGDNVVYSYSDAIAVTKSDGTTEILKNIF